LSAILGAVVLFTVVSALILNNPKIKLKYSVSSTTIPSVSAFFLTAVTLAFVRYEVSFPILIFDRFIPGTGWVEIFLLSLYAAVITEKMLDPAKTALWRRRIWTFFSVIFFAQLILGLLGWDVFLMTGELHLPIPAMIIAGPLYRGEGIFMLVLFASTVVLVGPAWCSHLCYIGAWDALTVRKRRTPKVLPKWRNPMRVSILIFVIGAAVFLRAMGVASSVATILGIIFGLIGVGIMVLWSRKIGSMVHCLMYCPIGVLADWLGKISPFRLTIDNECTDCGKCRLKCRYDALNLSDIQKRRPNITCTLCGDCINSCDDGFIKYRFLKLRPETARALFLVLVISLQACTVGLARI
jgi:polyferredoxin